ncbi:MAG: hypothetical protein QOH16_2152 [Gaiellaceae bacterium]|nr:hypothetical protein [Gaiellaceae bacterium]
MDTRNQRIGPKRLSPPPLSYDEYRELTRFPALDGLRAVAILLVFTAHPAYRHFWPRFHGSNGVTVFFVLSGFLITTLALREETRLGRLDLRSFYTRRLCRIYPLYTAVLLLYVLLIMVVGFQADRRARFVEELPYYSLGLPEHGIYFRSVVAPFDGAWSLGIEEKFYLLWPVALAVTAAALLRWRYALLAVIGVTSIVAPYLSTLGAIVSPYVHIVFGCTAGLILNNRRSYDAVRWLGRERVLAAVVVGWGIVQFAIPGTTMGGALYAPYGAVATVLLVSLVITRAPWVKWLWSRPMVTLATLSYGLYLVHNFGLNLAEKGVPLRWGLAGSLLSTTLGLAAAFVAAWILHRTVERPFIAWGRRRVKKREPQLATQLP